MTKWTKWLLLSSASLLLVACTDPQETANESSLLDETSEVVESESAVESLEEVETVMESEESVATMMEEDASTSEAETETEDDESISLDEDVSSEEVTESDESESSDEKSSENESSEDESSEDESSKDESSEEASSEDESSKAESSEEESSKDESSEEESSEEASESDETSFSEEETVAEETEDTIVATTEAVEPVVVDMYNQAGDIVGTATLEEAGNGIILTLELEGLPEGEFGFHIHEYGKATPPTFLDALGHFNPTGASHGIHAEGGPHMGDFPNLVVGEDGKVEMVLVISNLSLQPDAPYTLNTENGTSLIIHEGADDHITQPIGNAGYAMIGGVIFAPLSEEESIEAEDSAAEAKPDTESSSIEASNEADESSSQD